MRVFFMFQFNDTRIKVIIYQIDSKLHSLLSQIRTNVKRVLYEWIVRVTFIRSHVNSLVWDF